jgi:hypothetical protein
MAFSTSADGDYILGAVNIECEQWDEENPTYGRKRNRPATSMGNLCVQVRILIGTCVLVGFAGTIWANLLPTDSDGMIEVSRQGLSKK